MKAGEIDISSVILRPMQVTDIADGMKLSVAEGWNQSEDDWKLLIENEQNVCVLAVYDKEIIGTGAVMNYANKIAWIGMVLVASVYRRQGISKLLLGHIFQKINSFESVKLDATPAGQQVYRKLGFKEEYLITRMVNLSVQDLPVNKEDSVRQVRPEDLHEIISLDRAVFGAERNMLIRSLIKTFPRKAWVIKRNNHINGFVLGRKGYRYHHIGPLIASTDEGGKALIIKALRYLSGKSVVVDVPCDKRELVNWLSSIGFVEQRRLVRMYKEKNPYPGDVEKYHLICGPEFG